MESGITDSSQFALELADISTESPMSRDLSVLGPQGKPIALGEKRQRS